MAYTYRIRLKNCGEGVTTSHELQNTIQKLKEKLHGKGLVIEQISIARYTATYSYATVTFDQDPPEDVRKEFKMDSEFAGFTPLVDNGDTSIDIIAVPGLGRHALRPWRSPDSCDVWLRDWLCVANARVLIYGYSTKLAESSSKATLQDHAKLFKNALIEIRESTSNIARPIIIVAHSLGGLVAKEALSLAFLEDQQQRLRGEESSETSDILKSTTALLFFGVPNHGMNSEQLTAIVEGQPNQSLVRDLQVDKDHEPSQFLQTLAQRFKDYAEHHPDFEIIAFYETEMSPTLEISATGKLTMTGPKRMLVTKNSACDIGLGHNFYQEEPLQKDHSGLVKFEDEYAPGFRTVKKHLRKQVEKAQRCLDKRKNRSTSIKPDERPLVLPFSKNPNFTRRVEYVDALFKSFLGDSTEDYCQRVALTGLGGVGKTQIVLHFAFELQEHAPEHAIFWVTAIDKNSFEKSYREIAEALQITGIDGKSHVKSIVKKALDMETSGKWLLIVDNADRSELFFKKKKGNLNQYLPKSRHGGILFTTRDHKAATDLVGPVQERVISVKELQEQDSEKLFLASLQSKPGRKEVKLVKYLVVDLLFNLPLAIVQAAAFLNQNQCTVSQYIKIYEESDESLIELLSQDFQDHGRYPEAKTPIATTWLISFEQIRKQDPLAANYMFFSSCLNEKNIPITLLRFLGATEVEQTKAIGTLKGFAFIHERPDKKSFDMHRLVHLMTRALLQRDHRLGFWALIAAAQVYIALDSAGNHLQYSITLILISHGNHVTKLLSADMEYDAEVAVPLKAKTGVKIADAAKSYCRDLLLRITDFHVQLRNYEESAEAVQRALEITKELNGAEDPHTIWIMIMLVVRLTATPGGIDKAERILEEALQMLSLRAKGENDTDATTIHWCTRIAQAKILYHRGKHNQAAKLLSELLDSQRLATTEQGVLPATMSLLGCCLREQGEDLDRAAALHREAWEIGKNSLGAGHQHRIKHLEELAQTLVLRGEYAEAQQKFEDVQRWQIETLGPNHPSTVASCHDHAIALLCQNKYQDAENMLLEILALTDDVCNQQTVKGTLAFVLAQQNSRQKDAAKMYHEVLEWYLRSPLHGLSHNETLCTLGEYSVVLINQKETAKAYMFLKALVNKEEDFRGIDQDRTLRSRRDLSSVCLVLEKYAEAEEVIKVVLAQKRRRDSQGVDDLHTLAVAVFEQGKMVEAARLLEELCPLSQEILGLEHWITLECHEMLADLTL